MAGSVEGTVCAAIAPNAGITSATSVFAVSSWRHRSRQWRAGNVTPTPISGKGRHDGIYRDYP
jgi:hypothetical protein